MILREPFSLTFGLIALLIFAFSGTLGKSIYNGAMKDCEKQNVLLLSEQREGPIRKCEL